jgi:DNA topoisomerase II
MTDLAKQYQRKTDKQHILDNPDTYIGSIENVDSQMWVYDDTQKQIVHKTIEYIPGLYKLFDEGIVNCRDHVIRMIHSPLLDKRFVTNIQIHVQEDGTIIMENDGNGIDVAKHPEYDVYIPEMVFGQLRTSTNYNKEEQKIVGGKNGFGFKLVLLWSSYGYVETVDHIRGLKYTQEFKDNLDTTCPPVITKCKSKPYTKVIFKPDYARFGLSGITADMFALLKKRTFDVAAVTDHSAKKIKVNFNDEVVPVKNFQQYIDLYIGAKDKGGTRVYETHDERWEYAVSMSPNHEFMSVSFVNGICTHKGGKHVDHIMNQITRKLQDYIEKKKKIKVNLNAIKEQLILFLRCDVVNPSFDSQTKDYLNTPYAKFGSTCTVSDGFIERVAKMGVMELACSLTEAKENKMAAKKTDGSKTKTIRGIANFIDANLAGTEQSDKCVLILCEGLSALSGIVSGLSSEDRNVIGIYPLKGKLLNVRGETITKISANKEITDMKKILGLENDKVYENEEDVKRNLRYSKVMILCDQDNDGSHIKGLCINLFHSIWASLVKIPGFLSFMNTPILRAKKGGQTVVFYNEGEYNTWKQNLGDQTRGWTVKYFKGLGTSTSAEFKEYFANRKIVDFVYDEHSDNTIDKIFNKKRTDDRKTWLSSYDKNSFLDTSKPSVRYDEFVDNELIHFSTYDCARSIPNMVDGLKTSLRKILFCAFKRKLTSEIKVAQFSGYVSEHSSYHHGEASLNGAIVNMAQNYVGSNNINLLEPNGQFGTRLHGGDDSASERYIFTMLNPLGRAIFPEHDDAILNYLDDDGTIVEPEYYVPIIPFALINGISGIGTGFSCNIPAFHPTDCVEYLKAKLTKKAFDKEFVPYYEGFKGNVRKIEANKFLVKGCYEVINDNSIRITELPVGTWTMSYTTFLESLMDGVDKNGKKSAPLIRDFTSLSTEVHVDFTITFPRGKMMELMSEGDEFVNGLEKALKLSTTISTSNIHMFDGQRQLHKYRTVEEIIDGYMEIRYSMYEKRKAHMIDNLTRRLQKLSNKAKYIQQTLSGEVDLRKKSAIQVEELMTKYEFDKIDGDFKYLIKMPMDSVTEENVAHIMKERDDATKELEVLTKTTINKMWLCDLAVFEKQYSVYQTKRQQIQSGAVKASKPIKKKAAKK